VTLFDAAIIVFVLILFLLITFYMQNRLEKKFVAKLKSKEEKLNTGVQTPSTETMYPSYMISYKEDQYGVSIVTGALGSSKTNDKLPKERKVPVKPIDVIGELARTPTNWSLNALDDKINILKFKRKLINQSQPKNDLAAMIDCLENRKKCGEEYKDGQTFKTFFEQWDATNEEKIISLTNKYNLMFESADIFVPEFPDIAVKIMTSYNEAVQALCDKKPRFYVIASAKDFQKQYAKRDPILVAQSPFGFYYHILGAWEKEMIYLPEL